MLRPKKLAILRRVLGTGRLKGDELVVFCPRHPSSAARSDGQLSINLTTDDFHCWSCGFGRKQNIAPLMEMGSPEDLREYLDSRAGARPVKSQPRTYLHPRLPDEFRSLSDHSGSYHFRATMEYLASRNVTSEDILRFKLGYCETGEYRGRVIFPSFDCDGLLNFFVGRSTWDVGVRRYKHPMLDKDIVFNDYLVDWSAPVVLVEGPFDMVQVENSVPLQGSGIREDSKLFRKLVTRCSDVYFALDADAFKKQLEIMKRFISYGVTCHHVSMDRKDPGAMDKEMFREAKRAALTVRSDFDILRIRACA